MSHTAHACPPADRLNDLLGERLLAADRDALEDHLTACSHCQQALLSASGDAHQWDRLESHLRSHPTDHQTPTDVLSNLKGAVSATRRASVPGRAPPSVPGYEILGELGRGGMAVVYRARHLALGREVALKVVLAGVHAAPEVRARLRREAEAVARLRHPGVVQVFDVGEDSGQPYFAMELVEGGTLRDRLRTGPLAPPDAAALVAAVARGVHAAHAAGVIHRDLKPANILLCAEGAPRVADFGLAMEVGTSGDGWTRTGDVLGTPAYMAPEQAQGRRADVGPATDVHALGVMLYESLTGRTPFAAGDDVSTLVQVSFEEPIPVRRLRASVPRDLETVCLKCLEKTPARRYASAGELADDLDRFLAGDPVRARPVSAPERVVKLARRHPLATSLLAGIVVVTAAGFAGVTLAMLDARSARDEEARQRGRAEEAGGRTLTALDRTERSAYLGAIAQARSQWLLNNVTGSARLLDRCPVERRGWEWHYLRGLNHGDLLAVPDTGAPWVTGVAYSPDGKWIAVSGGDPYASPNTGTVQTLDAATGRVLWRKEGLPHLVRNLAYSPDGRLLATAGGNWREDGGGKLRTWDAATGAVVRDFPGHDQEAVYRVAFSPDGRRLASTSHERATRVWDVGTGAEVFRAGASEADSIAFTPDGRFLVFDGPDGIVFRGAATGVAVRVTPRVTGRFALSPDGTRLATAHRDQLRVWDVSAGAGGVALSLVHAFNGHEGLITDLAFRPDGQGVATAGADGTVRLWELGDAEPLVLRGHTGRVGAVAFHPDGRAVASGGKPPGDFRVWDATRKAECVTAVSFSRERRDIATIGFTGNDRELLALAEGGALRRWDCATGRTAECEVPYSAAWAVPGATAAFSGDGQVVATVTGPRDRPSVIRVAETATGRKLATLCPPEGKVLFVACDRTGERIATGGACVRDGKSVCEVRVWDARRGTVLHEASSAGEKCEGVALSPDGSLLLDARRGSTATAVLTDLTGAAPPRPFTLQGSVAALALSPRGLYVAAADTAGAVHVWDRSGKPVHDSPLPGPAGLSALAFSPDEARLAGVNRERVQVWDVASGQDVLFLRGAGPRPSDNSFNPRVVWSHDGTKLAASNWDRTVSVWDAAASATASGKVIPAARAAAWAFEWHRERTEAYTRPETTFAAAFHRDRALARPAETPFELRQQGDFLARLGRWKEACVAYALLLKDGLPDSPEVWREYATLLLATGDHAAYGELRRVGLWRWAGANEIRVLDPLIHLSALLPAPPVEAALLLVAAENYRGVAPTERASRAALAAALDRAGNPTRAREELDQALGGIAEGEWVNAARARRALASARLGLTAGPEADLEAVEEWLATRSKRLPPATAIAPAEWEWATDWEVRVLRAERVGWARRPRATQ